MLSILGAPISYVLGAGSNRGQAQASGLKLTSDEVGVASSIQFVCTYIEESSETEKKVSLLLRTGKIIQIDADGLSEMTMCAQISVLDHDEDTLILHIKGLPGEKSRKAGKYRFSSGEEAADFKKYINARKEYGLVIIAAFESIDKKATNLISAQSLKAALSSEGFLCNDDELRRMLSLHNNGNHHQSTGISINFDSFFRLLSYPADIYTL